MKHRFYLSIYLAALMAVLTTAHAAEIYDRRSALVVWGHEPAWDIIIDGPILPGDDIQFSAVFSRIKQRPSPKPWPIFVWLQSPGGQILASERIADQIYRSSMWTHVRSECASSCFMLFMAGINRTFSPNAKIGVHSARDIRDSVETPAALEATMMMIRRVQFYKTGMPHSVIGKLAGTLGSKMAWLSRAELQEIGATLYPPDPAPPHTALLLDKARAFVMRYQQESPNHAASYGGHEDIMQNWLECYGLAYSTGDAEWRCGGHIPRPYSAPSRAGKICTDGCVTGARDYKASLRAADVPN